jgi:hypothetical protein
MQGLPLSPREVRDAIASRVQHFLALDLDRASAIRAVAREHHINPAAIAWALQEHATATNQAGV